MTYLVILSRSAGSFARVGVLSHLAMGDLATPGRRTLHLMPRVASANENRYGPVGAAIVLLRAIRHRPKTLAELAADLACSARTVRRMVNALRGVGVTITERRREHHDASPLILEYWWDGKL